MHPDVARYLRVQNGLITAQQALSAGIPDAGIQSLVASGAWTRVRWGVYVDGTRRIAENAHGQELKLQDDAACLALGPRYVRSHQTAARCLGMEVLWTRRTHLTIAAASASRREPTLTVHVGALHAGDVLVADGKPCTHPARTALDIARENGIRHGVVAIDAALRIGTTQQQLAGALTRMRRWPRITHARAALQLADSGAESPGESLARLLVIELGHGRPETQFGLTDGERTGFSDLRLGRHLIEFDGKSKYRADGARPEDSVWEEKRREDWFRSFNLGMSRLTWDECLRPTPAVFARLEREYQSSCQRYGTSIEDLDRWRIDRRRGA